jgi:hypothetical protein
MKRSKWHEDGVSPGMALKAPAISGSDESVASGRPGSFLAKT